MKEMAWVPGWQELLIILVIIVFIFGAKRLKDVARGTGEAVREFKKASEGPREKEEEEAVIEAARKMGIETEGKDIKRIIEEMNKKVAEKEK